MSEIDYNRIEKIAEKAARNAQNEIVAKTIRSVLAEYGIHDPAEMRNLVTYGAICMRNKRDIQRGFFGGIGGHFATALITIAAVWVATTRGMFN